MPIVPKMTDLCLREGQKVLLPSPPASNKGPVAAYYVRTDKAGVKQKCRIFAYKCSPPVGRFQTRDAASGADANLKA